MCKGVQDPYRLYDYLTGYFHIQIDNICDGVLTYVVLGDLFWKLECTRDEGAGSQWASLWGVALAFQMVGVYVLQLPQGASQLYAREKKNSIHGSNGRNRIQCHAVHSYI